MIYYEVRLDPNLDAQVLCARVKMTNTFGSDIEVVVVHEAIADALNKIAAEAVKVLAEDIKIGADHG